MSSEFEPKLSILPSEQRRFWNELIAIPKRFVLIGGTAIAIQLGHRTSIDFDFISSSEFDPDELYASIPILAGSIPIQKSANTLTCLVDRGGKVQVSFFGTPQVRLTRDPLIAHDNRVQVASLEDLAGMKAAVVQKRAEARDYLDVDALIDLGGVSLRTALTVARKLYGPPFNPLLTLKALSFFSDGNLPSLPVQIRERLLNQVREFDLSQISQK